MQHYVLIFRTSRALTPAELKQRPAEIQLWVKHVTSMGIAIDPKALGPFAIRFTQQNGTLQSQEDPADPALVNFVFFDAPTEAEAVEVARSHPGLRYGVSVELRNWTTPGPAPQASPAHQ
ncbi:MAG TPA: hypothetical protein VK764_13625 [Terracidiphilus sp.]|jgi:hypothetical protein|nr:hypothetical protein [Terracidiphilus sp.]